jgi:IS30 family transposase
MKQKRAPAKPFTPEEDAKIQEMLEDGVSLREIERTLGRSQGVISHRYTGQGWTVREAGAWGAYIRHGGRKL